MHNQKYVFAQVMAFLDNDKFSYIVKKLNGNKFVRHFTCWNQLLTLMFGQLSARNSLRDLINLLQAHQKKLFHLGIGKSVTLSNVANAMRDAAQLGDIQAVCRIYDSIGK